MRELRILLGFFAVVIVLLLLGFAELYTVTNSVKAEQARACALRQSGRAASNRQQIPIRLALRYIGDLIVGGAARQPSAAKRAQSRAVGRRFESYAAQIKPYPNPNC